MIERLTDEQLRANLTFLHNKEPTVQEIIDMHVRVVKLKEENIALRARVAKLEAALKPFADAHFYYNDAGKPDDLTTGIGGVTYGDFRQAVSILAEGEMARAALEDAPQ